MGVATVRQTLSRVFSAMAAERAKKRRKLVLTPDYDTCASASALRRAVNRGSRHTGQSIFAIL